MNNFLDEVPFDGMDYTGADGSTTISPNSQQQRYDLRPRPKSRSDVIQIPVNPALRRDGKTTPSPTSVLRHFGIVTYSSYVLGAGHYSKVYKGYQGEREVCLSSSTEGPQGWTRPVAIKVVRLNLVGADFKRRFIPREKECWSKLRHRNICELYACFGCDEYGYLYMVMEYCSNGDLLSHLQKHGPLSLDKGKRWMRALLDAVNYLHKNKIAHRDIKAENVLISRRQNVKLTDFGFVCKLTDNHYSRTYCGSRAYSSPEVLKGIPYDVFKNDVWSLGVLCFVAMTSSMPFREVSNINSQIVEQQRAKTYRWPSYITPECRQSIDAMLEFHQDRRPTAMQAKKLPFFQRTFNQQLRTLLEA